MIQNGIFLREEWLFRSLGLQVEAQRMANKSWRLPSFFYQPCDGQILLRLLTSWQTIYFERRIRKRLVQLGFQNQRHSSCFSLQSDFAFQAHHSTLKARDTQSACLILHVPILLPMPTDGILSRLYLPVYPQTLCEVYFHQQ